MRNIILSAFVLAATTCVSQAAYMTFTTGGARGHQILLSDGATRVATSAPNVRVGYLNVDGDSTSFVEFGTTIISNPLSSAPVGGFISQQTGNNANATTINAFKGKQVALWIYGQNGDQGLFTSTAWLAPEAITIETDSTFPISLGITQAAGDGGTSQIPVTGIAISGFNTASYQAPVTITVGTTGTTTNTRGASYILGAPIPEPASVGLLALAGLVAARRRR